MAEVVSTGVSHMCDTPVLTCATIVSDITKEECRTFQSNF